MGAPFAAELLGWKHSSKNKLLWSWVPNSADVDNPASLNLAAAVLEALGMPNPNVLGSVPPTRTPPANPGPLLEDRVREHLAQELPRLDDNRRWSVRRGVPITAYAQFQHLTGITRAAG